ncbi:MAG TPA: helix-turn-helix domain-containing protein [Acidimicrobiia bacterium]
MAQPISADSQHLSQTISDLTSALGDPTRRAVYIAIRESPEPMNAADIAALFDIHPNVARHHLDKLAGDGYLDVAHRRPNGRSGPGAGRPAKYYTVSAKQIDVHFPTHRHDVLSDMLVRIIDRIAPDNIKEVAEEVGAEVGRELAGEIGSPDDTGYEGAVRAVVRAMTGIGFGVSSDVAGQRLLMSHCPFGETAAAHPDVVCSLDRGMVAGLMGSLEHACDPVIHPAADSPDDCITEVPISIRRS